MKTLLLLTLSTTLLACVSVPSWTSYELELEPLVATAPTAPSGRNVTIAPTIDARPEASKTDIRPVIESRYNVLVAAGGGAMINGARVEGPTCHRGERLIIRAGGTRLTPVALIDRIVQTGLSGRVGERVELGEVSSIAAQTKVRDGVLVVPILDQLDVCRMSSVNSMSGGGSTRTTGVINDTVTTHSGAATFSATSPSWANLRMRLLVVDIEGGQTRSSRWVFVRGAGEVDTMTMSLNMPGRKDPLGLAIADTRHTLQRASSGLFDPAPTSEPVP